MLFGLIFDERYLIYQARYSDLGPREVLVLGGAGLFPCPTVLVVSVHYIKYNELVVSYFRLW